VSDVTLPLYFKLSMEFQPVTLRSLGCFESSITDHPITQRHITPIFIFAGFGCLDSAMSADSWWNIHGWNRASARNENALWKSLVLTLCKRNYINVWLFFPYLLLRTQFPTSPVYIFASFTASRMHTKLNFPLPLSPPPPPPPLKQIVKSWRECSAVVLYHSVLWPANVIVHSNYTHPPSSMSYIARLTGGM